MPTKQTARAGKKAAKSSNPAKGTKAKPVRSVDPPEERAEPEQMPDAAAMFRDHIVTDAANRPAPEGKLADPASFGMATDSDSAKAVR